MNTNLTKNLIEKNALEPGVLIGIATRYPDDYKTFSIKSIHCKLNNYYFHCGGEFKDVKIEQDIPAELVVQIEGMSLERFAETHSFYEDGTPINTGKRRGRKRKHVQGRKTKDN